jgi:hypothetical protein
VRSLEFALRGLIRIFEIRYADLTRGIRRIHRIIPDIPIEVHLIRIPNRIRLQEPPQRGRVIPRPVEILMRVHGLKAACPASQSIDAQLGADVVRHSFIAVASHHLLLAAIPAH